jgi:hypothetical protein
MLISKTANRSAITTAALALSALGLAAGTCVVVSPAQAASFGTAVRIDVGGAGLTTSDGAVWGSDRYVTGGTQISYGGTVAGTKDAQLYRTARSGLTAIRVPGLPAAKYEVTLLFAETSVRASGQRVQRVVSEGEVKRSSLDVYASAGFAKAWSTSFLSAVKDGTLDLTFVPVRGKTQLAGLIVTPQGSPSSTTTSTTAPTSTSTSTPTSTPTSTSTSTSTPTSTTTSATTPTSTSTTSTSTTSTGTATRPSQILDLRNWKLTVPVDTSQAGSPDEFQAAELAGFEYKPYFLVDPTGTGVVFAANAGGRTTSGSGYPRSELREMANGGKTLASWSTTSGTHTMTITQAVTQLTPVKPHIVVGQIHDANDDVMVIRLEGRHLFVDHNGVQGNTLSNDYQLGTRFTVTIVAAGGHIKTYYNGSTTAADDYAISGAGCYFKAGAYVQSNPTKGHDAPDAVGANTIYELNVSHVA